jgi:zinc protease
MSNMKTFKLFIALASCLFAVGAYAQSESFLPADPAVRYGKLPNGLTYYIRHNEYPKERVDFYIAQRVGSIVEEENQRGLAHFLEHMAFNGSKHFPVSGDLARYCENIGVNYGRDLNAYTSVDETVYNVCSVPSTAPNYLDSCLFILADWADGLLLQKDEIDKERGVIHEEWRMRSSAVQRMYERDLPQFYPNSRYANRMPIGLMSVVDNFKPEALRAYYEKWYRPDLQGIIVVGNVDVDQVEQKIKQIFGGIKMPKNPAKRVYYDVPDNNAPIVVVDKDKEMTNSYITTYFKYNATPDSLKNTVAVRRAEYIRWRAMEMLDNRFNEAMQKADAPFNSAGCGDDEYIFAKTKRGFELECTPKEGQSAAALKAVLAEALRAAKFGFLPSEFARENENHQSELETLYTGRNKMENSYYTSKYIRHFLDNDPYYSIEDYVKGDLMFMQTVKLEDVNAMMKQMVASLDTNVVVIGFYPEKEGVTVPTKEELQQALSDVKTMPLTAYVDNTKTEPLIPNLPKAGSVKKELAADNFGYKGFVLSNGIKVLYKKTDFKDDEIMMSAVSKGGMSLIPTKDIENAMLITPVMYSNGLGNFNSIELKKKLAGKQYSIGPSVNSLSETLDGTSTPKDIRTLFEQSYLYFTNVNYDTLAYQTLMRRVKESYKNRSVSPQAAFSDSVTTTLYNHNPRRLPMTLARLNKVNYDEVLRLYHQRFADAGDFTFIFTGALNEDSIRTLACQYLATLPVKGTKENFVDQHIDYCKGIVSNKFTRKMETPSSMIREVWSCPMKNTAKNRIVADATGQLLTMVYDKVVREEKSFVYAIGSRGDIDMRPKEVLTLFVGCPVKPEKSDSTQLIIGQEMDKIAANGPDELMLKRVKEVMVKDYNDYQRKNDYWSSLQSGQLIYGIDQRKGELEAINALTGNDIRDLLRTVIAAKNRATIVMMPQQ